MGNIYTYFFKTSSAKKYHEKVLLLGLEDSGKTTILYNIVGKELPPKRDRGYNAEVIVHDDLSFWLWDVYGNAQNRSYVRHFAQGARALIFVVDSCDRENIDYVNSLLWRMLDYDNLTFTEILVYATKQDIPNAMTVYEISEKLGFDSARLRRLPRDIKWYVQECSGKTGSGLFDGLSWIAQRIHKSPQNLRVTATQ